MVPAAHDDEDSKYYVKDKEDLVGEAAEIENAQDQHSTCQYSGDDTPQPIWLDGLNWIAA